MAPAVRSRRGASGDRASRGVLVPRAGGSSPEGAGGGRAPVRLTPFPPRPLAPGAASAPRLRRQPAPRCRDRVELPQQGQGGQRADDPCEEEQQVEVCSATATSVACRPARRSRSVSDAARARLAAPSATRCAQAPGSARAVRQGAGPAPSDPSTGRAPGSGHAATRGDRLRRDPVPGRIRRVVARGRPAARSRRAGPRPRVSVARSAGDRASARTRLTSAIRPAWMRIPATGSHPPPGSACARRTRAEQGGARAPGTVEVTPRG